MKRRGIGFIGLAGKLLINKKAKESFLAVLLFSVTLSVLLMAGYVFAFASEAGVDAGIVKVYNSSGSLNTLSVNPNLTLASEGTQFYFFINISNPEVAQSGVGAAQTNITNVTITFDRSVIITGYNMSHGNNSGGTSQGGVFNNNSEFGNEYVWFGQNLINTSGNGTFEFNGIINVPGTYNITIQLGNATATGGVNFINVTYFYINDSTGPNNVTAYSNSTGLDKVTPVYRTFPTTRANVSDNTTYLSVNVRDFYECGAGGVCYRGENISSVNFSLYYQNSSSVLNSSLIHNANLGDINESFAMNWTNLADGHYYINVSFVNDSKGNINYTGLGFNITLDKTVPSVSLAKSGSSTKNKLVIDITVSDATSGINGKTCTVTGGNGKAVVTGNSGSQSFEEDGLSCSGSYTYDVTCTDHSGNSKKVSQSFEPDGCDGGSSSGGGGGSGGSTTVWKNTIVEDKLELSEIGVVSKQMAEKERVKLKVNGKEHFVGVKEISGNKVTVEVSSNPSELELAVGETGKFDLEEDGFYDLSVKLESLEGQKANLIIEQINERVPEEQPTDQEGEAETESEGSGKKAVWIIVPILIIIGVVLAVFLRRNRFK